MDIRKCKMGDKIVHIESGVAYTYVGKSKVKLEGDWILVRSYYNDNGDLFHRLVDDFEGFKPQ